MYSCTGKKGPNVDTGKATSVPVAIKDVLYTRQLR